MPGRIKTRHAISALLDAGKRSADIVWDLGYGRTLVHKIKALKVQGKDISSFKRKRKNTIMTPRVTAAVRKRIKAASTKSLRRVAREAGLKRESVRKVVIQSGWKSLRRTNVPLISANGRERHAKRAVGLVNALKSKGHWTIFFFSDEKTFVVDPIFNPQNNRWIRITEEEEDNEDDEED